MSFSTSDQNLNSINKRKADESEAVRFSSKRLRDEYNDVDRDIETDMVESSLQDTIGRVKMRTAESAPLANNSDEIDYVTSTVESVKPPRIPVLTEGSTMQKITVGNQHQAVIPLLGSKALPYTRAYPPELVWAPGNITDSEINKYIVEAGEILNNYMKDISINITRYVPYNVDIKHLTSPRMQCRELNIDQILKLLHEQDYNVSQALDAIQNSPEQFLFIWTKEEKLVYDLGFKMYYNDIRHITKGFGSHKNHRDVIDYFYRFKIPDQFRLYQDQKRDQARRILECVERHKRNEYLPPENTVPVSNNIGSKKLAQLW